MEKTSRITQAARAARRRRGRGGRCLFQFLIFEDLDGLRLAVFGDGEIGGLQAFDGIAIFVLGR